MEDSAAPLFVLTGAPGSGKSALTGLLADAAEDLVVIDIDDLLEDGRLLGVRIAFDDAAEIWPDYNRLWIRMLGLILRSGVPVLFLSPLDPDELHAALPARFAHPIHWATLDCTDAERRIRLHERGWDDAAVAAACDDAAALRSAVPTAIANDGQPKSVTAQAILAWVERLR